jgi:hypothetical protein
MPQMLFTPGKDPVSIVQEAGWAPVPVWTGAENLAPTGIQSQAVQPVASRYIDYATRPIHAHTYIYYNAMNVMDEVSSYILMEVMY